MSWLLINALIAFAGLLLIGGVVYAGYQQVRQLLRAAKGAGSRISAVTDQLDELQRQGASSRTP